MMLENNYPRSKNVSKMFPVSFERPDKYDRVLSEEHLIDWIRGIVPNSSNMSKNSPYSYVVTESLPPDFGKHPDSELEYYIEFMIGGYYVKLSDKCLTDIADGKYIFAVITESTNSTTFRSLVGGGGDNSDEDFSALELIAVNTIEKKDTLYPKIKNDGTHYTLHILNKDADGNYSIPEDSLRSSSDINTELLNFLKKI